MERHLAAIMAADVAGFGRLVEADEEGTLATLHQSRAILDAAITRHHGRIANTAGDSVVAEFSSVVDAVRAAVGAQRELADQNKAVPAERRLQFRMGVNLGDVVAQGNDLLGDGVNIAARLASRAEPGEVLISTDAFRQVRNKLHFNFEDLGEHRLKNIAEPVRTYRVSTTAKATGAIRFMRLDRRHGWFVGFAAVVMALAILVLALNDLQVLSRWFPWIDTRIAFAESSIVVLPFQNLSGDVDQEYFSDGLTSDLTTDLSKFRNLFVVASNSAYTYKGKPTKVQDISRELRVRYVLEGTVQRGSNKIRINSQLIDGTTGKHIWAERYERDVKDLFDVQNDIIRMIVTRLAVEVDEAEASRAMRKETQNMEAQDYYWRGLKLHPCYEEAKCAESRNYVEEAIRLDPTFARAYSLLAYTYLREWRMGWGDLGDKALEKADELVQKSLQLDADDYYNYWTQASLYLYKDCPDCLEKALAAYETAIRLNPNDADLLAESAETFVYAGDPERAVRQIKDAMARNPRHQTWYYYSLSWAEYQAKKYQDAYDTLMTAPGELPAYQRITLAAILARLSEDGGQDSKKNAEEAGRQIEQVIAADPDWSLEREAQEPYKSEEDRRHWVGGLEVALAHRPK